MNGWPTRIVGDLVTLQRGIDLPEGQRRPGQVPIMGSFGVTGCHDKAAIKSPGLTVGRSGGSIGVVSYIEEDFWPLNTCLYVRDFHGNNPRFAYYLLQTLDLKALDSGSAQPSLNRNFVHLLPIRFPGREEQDAIASILSAFDDKIDLNRRMNETLEAMARAIFRDWFVDFGPTRAKMEGRPPYLAADLWSLFPDQLDDEGKPEGWSSRPFGSLLTDNIGGDWGTDSPEGENTEAVSIIRGTDLSSLADGYVGKVPTRYTTEKKLSNRKLKSYDIIVEVSGGSPTQPTGRSLLILDSVLGRFSAPVVCASFCRRFRPSSKPEAILAAQHLQHLYSIGGTWEYQNQSTGISNFQTKHFLEKELVVWPAPELAERFFSMVSPLLEAKAKNESLVLSATRDLLLPKLMSGEIRLRDAETLMEKVL